MKTQEFDYELPEWLIAQTPLPNRDNSRLLVLNRSTREFEHRRFRDIVNYPEKGDVMVINDTRVIPARLFGRRKTGGRVEVLLLKPAGPDLWECLVRPGHKTRPGEEIFIRKNEGSLVLKGTIEARTSYGGRLIKWFYEGDWSHILEQVGHTPLPPYIKTRLEDQERYQTVYALRPGSAAAPTAGLHFTASLLDVLSSKGVVIVSVTLDVGLDTFRPVTEDVIQNHVMHAESCEISRDAAHRINEAKAAGKRVFAVGTTVVRTLESSSRNGMVLSEKRSTDLFIYPGYEFKVVDCLVTNFHLPKSTLLMLVSAFSGKEFIMDAYQEAIREEYRFFSFGDAMLIL